MSQKSHVFSELHMSSMSIALRPRTGTGPAVTAMKSWRPTSMGMMIHHLCPYVSIYLYLCLSLVRVEVVHDWICHEWGAKEPQVLSPASCVRTVAPNKTSYRQSYAYNHMHTIVCICIKIKTYKLIIRTILL